MSVIYVQGKTKLQRHAMSPQLYNILLLHLQIIHGIDLKMFGNKPTMVKFYFEQQDDRWLAID